MLFKKKILIIICHLLVSLLLFGSQSHAEESLRTLYNVSNMSCGSCVIKIDHKLKSFEGYVGLLANVKKGLVAVDHKPALTDEEITEAMTAIGYPAEAAADDEIEQLYALSSESPGWRSPSKGLMAKIIKFFN